MKFKLTAASGDVLHYPLSEFRISNEESRVVGKVPPQWTESSCDIEFDTLEELMEFVQFFDKRGAIEIIVGLRGDNEPNLMIYDDHIE